ncbi:MAG: cytochrome c biogenesis protein CcdA [Actinomycetota bacterium]
MSDAKPGSSYLVLVVATLAVALIGYVGYVLYPRFDLPAGVGASLLLLSAAGGVASFFSPCGFPLLVTVVSRDMAPDEGGYALARALRTGSWLSLGAATFVLLVGSLIALGAGGFFRTVTFTSAAGIVLRAIVGAFLLVMGLVQIGVLRSPFGPVEDLIRPLLVRQAQLRRERPSVGFAALGFGYLLAGFG